MLANATDDGGTIAASVEDVTPLAITPLALAVNAVAGDDIELVMCSSIFAVPVAASCQ